MWRALNEDTAGSLPAEPSRQLAPLEALAAIPEEEIWLAKQKSAQTRRAYRLDVQHFMRALGITTTAALRQVDHRAIIAWERMQREQEGARRFHCAPTPGGPFQPVQAPGETRGGRPKPLDAAGRMDPDAIDLVRAVLEHGLCFRHYGNAGLIGAIDFIRATRTGALCVIVPFNANEPGFGSLLQRIASRRSMPHTSWLRSNRRVSVGKM